jgi:hypothetical protein
MYRNFRTNSHTVTALVVLVFVAVAVVSNIVWLACAYPRSESVSDIPIEYQ